MNIKEEYYNQLIANKGRLTEIELGEKLGLDENETQRIISQLLSEYKIEHKTNKACDYSLLNLQKLSRM